MLRVVLDVNILISALIMRGKPKDLWLKGVRKEYALISSEKLLADFIRVISRTKFRPYIKKRDLTDFLETFHLTAELVEVKSTFKVVDIDPDDDILLNTAYDSDADYTVSGDKHLLALKEFKGIKTVTISQMLDILRKIIENE